MKKIVSLLMALLMITSILTGCQNVPVGDGQTTPQDDTVVTAELDTKQETEARDTLWIVMEEHEAMELLVDTIIDKFERIHSDVEIELEVLPNGNKRGNEYKAARDAVLQRIRSAIMSGKGPDVFLLPSTTTTYEMLFEDVNLAMRNYLFADISEYYDGDMELGKEELLSGVMDAGVVDGARYILPLRYDMPVAYVDVAQFEAHGGSLDMFDGGIMELYKNLLATGNSELIAGAFVSSHAMEQLAMNFCGEVINYDECEVQLTTEELAEFMSTVQTVRDHEYVAPENWMQRAAVNSPPTLVGLFGTMEHWTDSTSMYIGRMQDLMDNAAYAKTQDVEIAMIPLPSANGKLTADVTYFGAVGGNCKVPAVAYEFLRLFLTEESQWSENKDTADEGYYLGWPVRVKGDVSLLWQLRKGRLATFTNIEDPEWNEEIKLLRQEYVSEILTGTTVIDVEDLPILDVAVNRAQLSIDLEKVLDSILIELNDSTTCEAIPADIDAMAAQWIEDLEWHLAEG